MKIETKNINSNSLLEGKTDSFNVLTNLKKIKIETKRISPAQARFILKNHNGNNRKPSKVVISKYSSDMEQGLWQQTAETISFDNTGKLLNGQHRLLACVSVDKPQEFVVAYGLAPEVFQNIDNGKIKTNADILGMVGYDNSTILSALTRSIISYEKSGTGDAKNFDGVNQITKSQILDYLAANPNVCDYIEKYKKNQIVSANVAAFCYWLLANIDKEKAEQYLDQILMGLNLEPETMQFTLFNKLQRNRNALNHKMTRTGIISNIILGWRKFTGISKGSKLYINWDARKGLPQPI